MMPVGLDWLEPQLATNYNCNIIAGENYNLGPLFFSTG
jgi:hypothetical protein